MDWWERANNATSDMVRQGVNSLIILGAWTLWKHRNRCVFDGAAPSVVGAVVMPMKNVACGPVQGLEGSLS